MAAVPMTGDRVVVGRWDGSTWSTLGGDFSAGLYVLDPAAVGGLVWHDDGAGEALYAAGCFTAIGGAPVKHVARWDGTSWSEVGGGLVASPTPGALVNVQSLASFDDGSGPSLYAAGRFASAGGVPANNIARWKNGVWSAMGAGLSHPVSTTGKIYSIAAFDDGAGSALYACGTFAAAPPGASGISEGQVARWTGEEWEPVEFSQANRWVLGLLPTESSLYVWGRFGRMDKKVTEGVAEFKGGQWHRYAQGFNGAAKALAVHDDGSGPALYAGGIFTLAVDVDAPGIARWDGQWWSPLPGLSGTVNALTQLRDKSGRTRLYAGGQFTLTGTGSVSAAVWDGESWSNTGSDNLRYINAMTVFDDGGGPALFAAGRTQGSRPVVAKYEAGAWRHIGTLYGYGNTLSSIIALTDAHGPALYVGGTFQYVEAEVPIPARNLARWSPTGGWSGVGEGVDDWVNALAVYPGPNGPALHVGGYFDSAGAVTGLNGLAKWDGDEWSRVGPGITGFVDGLGVVREHGRDMLYIGGGGLTHAGGVPARGVAKWDGTTFSALGSGIDAGPTTFISHDDGAGPSVFMGGSFYYAGGIRSQGMARWFLCDGCYANCDGSTSSPVLSVADFACFLNAFAAGSPYANCDGSTVAPALNVRDFHCFLNSFASGCP